VQGGELEVTDRPDVVPMRIRSDAGHLDRELAFLLDQPWGTDCHLDLRTRFGGYLPLHLSHEGSRRCLMVTSPVQLPAVAQNRDVLSLSAAQARCVSQATVSADEQFTVRLERGARLTPSLRRSSWWSRASVVVADDGVQLDLPGHRRLSWFGVYDGPESVEPRAARAVWVRQDLWPAFRFRYRAFLQGGAEDAASFTYDNLIHLLIMVKDAGELWPSVLRHNGARVDRWTVYDTGSTDDTVAVAQRILGDELGLPGEVHEGTFEGFATSRNRLLDLADATRPRSAFYLMLDDTYRLCTDWTPSAQDASSTTRGLRRFLEWARADTMAESLSLHIGDTGMKYSSNRVFKPERGIRYMYEIHEVPKANFNVVIPEVYGYIEDLQADYMDVRSRQRRQQDLRRLHAELQKDPSDARTYYYLGQTYRGLQQWKRAVFWYRKRAEAHRGFPHEQYDAKFYVAELSHHYLRVPWSEAQQLYLEAYQFKPDRSDPLICVGFHYHQQGGRDLAYFFFRAAFELGLPHPNDTMSNRMGLYCDLLPKYLAPLCLLKRQPDLAFRVSQRRQQHLKQPPEYQYARLYQLVQQGRRAAQAVSAQKDWDPEHPLVLFAVTGGWAPWSGSTLEERGLGGTETCVIRLAEGLVQRGYSVWVFCRVDQDGAEHRGVRYRDLKELVPTLCEQKVQAVVVHRDVPTVNALQLLFPQLSVSLMLHDLATGHHLLTHSLRRVLVLTEWHRLQFQSTYGDSVPSSLLRVQPYGIDSSLYCPDEASRTDRLDRPRRFLFPSFPNRGLLPLLQVWERLVSHHPDLHLDVFCDLAHEWTLRVASGTVEEIKVLLKRLESTGTVTNHGWVPPDQLRRFWQQADVWFYPCTFPETFCRVALEAAASRTLAITNLLAGLQNTVGLRGVGIPGDVASSEWQDTAVANLLDVLSGQRADEFRRLVDQNYQWALEHTWSSVLASFVTESIASPPPLTEAQRREQEVARFQRQSRIHQPESATAVDPEVLALSHGDSLPA